MFHVRGPRWFIIVTLEEVAYIHIVHLVQHFENIC